MSNRKPVAAKGAGAGSRAAASKDRSLSATGAAELLGVCRKTIWHWITRGYGVRIDGSKPGRIFLAAECVGHDWRIEPAAIKRFQRELKAARMRTVP
jgi:predicted DNA-binding transcriptional regulator AlpA